MKKLKVFSSFVVLTLLLGGFSFSSKAEEVDCRSTVDTELVFVVDKSGSMQNLTNDTIGSFNSVMETQKNSDEPGNVYVTTVLFNHGRQKVHDRVNINDVAKLTTEDYKAEGMTALLDAVGSTISELSANEGISKNKVVFVVITDGYENSSREFRVSQVKSLIDEKSKEGWNFVFLGSNIDSAKVSSGIGINPMYARNFDSSSEGVMAAFSRVNSAIDRVRSGSRIDLDAV